ncbi:TPA: hypothetical protein JZ414_001100 [Staphylococcus aureus]|nr:hypothetical protein [Staphylococcus aureus]HAR6670614.1 hypothetical protein [Staphylococcus aureus]HAR6681437.1 hypothetical protein [Staphylococcus aureus]HAR6688893.1 hypothetical protein [Staphylococcus aureus]HAR6702389.1 hypothetical protein [Staphylococcus aureus]
MAVTAHQSSMASTPSRSITP